VNDHVDSGGDVAQKFAAEIVSLATRRPKRERPKRELPAWADRCIKDDMERIIPNLANVLVALRALPELADAFAYDSMLRVTILRKELPVAPGERARAPGRFRDPCVTRM
jgi:hypothetical protein